ncbi:MAG: YfhO family protein [Patescibacteria group bacterium]|nr:YfhO family protein [Patescibacteria group bacterium]
MIYKKLWDLFIHSRYYFLILAVVLLFFFPVFKGQVPFPGDLLVNENPYKTESFLGYASQGYPNKAQGPDVIKLMYPWRHFAIEELKKGNMPFWNPYNFSGNPQIANFQTALFYPFNILYFIFSFNSAWTMIVMLQPFLAGIFMYLFLSKDLGLRKFPSFIGGLAFAFSSYMVVWIEYGNIGNTFLWLPLALLLTKRIYQKITAVNYVLFIVVLVFTILAGYIQSAFYSYLVIILYYLYLFKFEKNVGKARHLIVFATSFIFSFLLTSFQLLPTLEVFINSARASYSLSQISKLLMPPFNLVTAFVPDFFGNPATRNYWIDGTYIERVVYTGVPMLFFAIYGILKSSISEKRFFIFICVASLIVATNFPLIKFIYLLPLPFLSTTVPTRELGIFIFASVVLSSMGINNWYLTKVNKAKIGYMFLLLYALIWFGVMVFLKPNVDKLNFIVTVRNLILPTFLAIFTVIVFYLRNKNFVIAKILLTLILIFDLFYFFNKITPFSSAKLIYPATPVISFLKENAGINRFWGYGSAYISPNFQTFDRTYSSEGYDALHLKSYGELLASSKDGVLPKLLPRSDANIAPGYGAGDLKNNFYRQRILDLLGVKYVLNQDQSLSGDPRPDLTTFPEEVYRLAWQRAPWQIYENKKALPRFFLASSYVVEKDKNQALRKIFDKETNLREQVILEENLPKDYKLEKDEKAELTINNYSSGSVKLKVKTNKDMLLFLSDNYFNGWNVSIDNKNGKIYKADYSFRAVAIPKGEHDIRFWYWPGSFNIGVLISIASVLGIVIFFILNKYKKIINV